MPDQTFQSKPAYHHGDLREALLRSAERILQEEGLSALTLRAAARAAGVSHAAPKNHFGTLAGLLSDLAAVGFDRFRDRMTAAVADLDDPARRLCAIGKSYVEFSNENPNLFLLMFRSDCLDYDRPLLKEASARSFSVLANIAGTTSKSSGDANLSVEQAARIAAAWSLVHGFATLTLDGRMSRILARTSPPISAMDLLEFILKDPVEH